MSHSRRTPSKTSEAKGGHTTRARAVASRRRRNPQSAEIKLAELRRRLLEINDLSAAGAVLRWDHATYMPRCGATARARQGAIVRRLAHEKSVARELGKLLDELEPYAASLPYEFQRSEPLTRCKTRLREGDQSALRLRGARQRFRCYGLRRLETSEASERLCDHGAISGKGYRSWSRVCRLLRPL